MQKLENERIGKLKAEEETEFVLDRLEKMKFEMERYQIGIKEMENKIQESYKNEHYIEVNIPCNIKMY